MSAWGQPLVFYEWPGNPHTTGQAAAGPKKIIRHRYYERVAPTCSSNIKNELKLKMKQDIQRLEIPDFGQVQKWGWVCHDHNTPL